MFIFNGVISSSTILNLLIISFSPTYTCGSIHMQKSGQADFKKVDSELRGKIIDCPQSSWITFQVGLESLIQK